MSLALPHKYGPISPPDRWEIERIREDARKVFETPMYRNPYRAGTERHRIWKEEFIKIAAARK